MSRAFRIDLSGANEVPPNASGVTGLGVAIFDDSGANPILDYTMVIRGLDWGAFTGQAAQTAGTATDNVTDAHFHKAAVGANGGVVLGWKGQDADDFSATNLFLDGAVPVATIHGIWETTDGSNINTQAASFTNPALNLGDPTDIYANIHTAAFPPPTGAARGQLVLLSTDNGETINGLAGVRDDILPGLGGNDIINPGQGNDTVDGGSGNDTIRFDMTDFNSLDIVNGGIGSDTLQFLTAVGPLPAGVFANVSGIETVTLANGTNDISLPDAMVTSATGRTVTVNGGTGNDTINASAVISAANRVSINAGAGDDTLTGGTGNDFFNFTVANFNNSDLVAGGSGSDTLRFLSAGTVTSGAFGGVSGVEAITLANGTNNVFLSNAMVAAATGQLLTVTGGTGDDVIDGSGVTSASNRLSINASNDGFDTLIGGAGNDTFTFGGTSLGPGDTVNGGAGIDTLRLPSDSFGPAHFADVTGIEILQLADIGGAFITLIDSLVTTATGRTLTVTSAGAGSADDIINGSAVTTAANRLLFKTGTGAETLTGGAGNDLFDFAAADLTAADTFAGGLGTDTLRFLTAGTVAAAAFTNVSNIEAVTLAAGTNNITLLDAMVASVSAQAITVQDNSGNDTIDASGLAGSRRVAINSFGGDDTLTGSINNDNFSFTAASLSNLDTVNGGNGADTLRFATAGTVTAAAFTNVTGIDLITLAGGTNNIALADAMVGGASGAFLSINGNSGNDTIDASALVTATNRVNVNAGAGADNLTGGAGNDTFSFTTSALDAADTVTGGAGTDTLRFLTAGTVAGTAFNNVTQVEVLTLTSGTNITLNDVMVGSANGGVVTVSGSTGDDTINASALTGANRVVVTSGGGNNNMIGGAGDDLFTAGAGFDYMVGNAGIDTFRYVSAAHSHEVLNEFDMIEGFSANDRMNFSSLTLTTSEAAILDRGAAAFVIASTADFFDDGGTDRAVAVQYDNAGVTRVYADTDGDGDYTLGTDFAIQFIGDVRALLNSTSDYIL